MDDVELWENQARRIAALIGESVMRQGLSVAVAESLTGGKISEQLAAAENSSQWFVGGVVAYQTWVKYDLLDVPEIPVVSEQAVVAMAEGAMNKLTATSAVAVSGVGGPTEEENQPPGTTWIAAMTREHCLTELHHFPGNPKEVLAQTQLRALELLLRVIQD